MDHITSVHPDGNIKERSTGIRMDQNQTFKDKEP